MPDTQVQHRYKKGQRVWVEVEGRSKRELAEIQERIQGDKLYYRVIYILGMQAGGTYLQGVVAEDKLGKYYG